MSLYYEILNKTFISKLFLKYLFIQLNRKGIMAIRIKVSTTIKMITCDVFMGAWTKALELCTYVGIYIRTCICVCMSEIIYVCVCLCVRVYV